MPIQQPTFKPIVTVDIANATESRITHLTLTSKDTEYSHALIDNLKQLRFRCQGNANLKYSFIQNESGTKYFSLYRGTCENIIDLDFTGKTLYIQSNQDSMVVEIMELY